MITDHTLCFSRCLVSSNPIHLTVYVPYFELLILAEAGCWQGYLQNHPELAGSAAAATATGVNDGVDDTNTPKYQLNYRAAGHAEKTLQKTP